VLTLRLTFPWGRYYAHPWGQNPARITEAEWPPSPWRLLRAIAAAWFQANPGCEPSAELIQTLEVLGRELPTFILPKISFSRAVHYQPNFGATAKDDVALAKYKRVRHENHFVAVGDDVIVQWRLDGVHNATRATVRALISEIAERITYFGRAESVCELTIEDEPGENLLEARVVMQQGQPCRQIGVDCRDVFCPNPGDFQATDLWKRRDVEIADGAAPKHLVQDLIDAPQPLPDGGAWYSFRMPVGWPQQWVVRHPLVPRRRKSDSSIVARYLEFSLQCRIPVPVKHIVSIAELFRNAAISIHRYPSYALSGHDRPDDLEIGHHHAFYLPQPDASGHSLDKLLVWCAHGFTRREVNALMSVGALRWAGGRFPVRPVLFRMQRHLPTPLMAKSWESVTPYVPPRYWYRKKVAEGRVRGSDSPENQLQQNLVENGVEATPESVCRIQIRDAEWDICKVHLSNQAQRDTAEPDRRVGVFLRVEFAEPVTMPFPSFGHSSHFGLGQFVPCGDFPSSARF
jgi:CRISPR-associated protein Csb2